MLLQPVAFGNPCPRNYRHFATPGSGPRRSGSSVPVEHSATECPDRAACRVGSPIRQASDGGSGLLRQGFSAGDTDPPGRLTCYWAIPWIWTSRFFRHFGQKKWTRVTPWPMRMLLLHTSSKPHVEHFFRK